MRRVVRSPHFWLVGPILGTLTIIHYFHLIGPVFGVHNPPLSLVGEATERTLYLLSMAYAGFVFGVVGGALTLVATVLILLPYAFFISPNPREAFLEIGGVAVVGLFMLLWFGAHYRERQRAEQALLELGIAQEKLSSQFQAVKDSERRSTALNVVSEVANRSLEVEQMRDSALEKVMEVMQAEVGWVYVVEEGTQELVLSVNRGLAEETVKKTSRLRLGEGLDGKVAQSGKPVLLENTGWGFGGDSGIAGLEDLYSVLIAPLKTQDQVIGAIGMAMRPRETWEVEIPQAEGQVVNAIGMMRRQGRHFTDEEMALLVAIGSQLGVAVENIRLFRTEQIGRRRSAALSAVATIVNQSLELGQVLDGALEKVSEVMGVDVSWVYLVQEETQEVVYAAQRGMSDEGAAILDRVKIGEGLNGRVAQSGEPIVVEDFSQDRGRVSLMAERENLRALLIAPLRAKGKIVGTIGVGTRTPRRFSSDETGLLCAIGDQIGIAIDNVRLYQREREIAQQLRESEQNYRDLFDNASDAIFVHDTKGSIVAVNKAFARLTGYTQGELNGMSIDGLLVPESLRIEKEMEQRQLVGELADGPFELTLVRRDGTEVVIELAARLITSGGQPVGFQHIARDVTEQRRRRDSLRFYIRGITKAQEEERKRVARELHDDTAQALVALSRDLDDLTSGGEPLPKRDVERLERLRQKTNDILEGVRRYSQDLRPSVVDDLGLLPGLEWLAGELSRQHGISTGVKVLGEKLRLEPESELALFRIAQEALNNVWKHSRATEAEILLEFAQDRVKMAVSDDGRGFEQSDSIGDLPSRGKLGLAGMQERARLLGGSLTIQSEPGKGTKVNVEIPISLGKVIPEEFALPLMGPEEFYFDSRFV